MSIASERMPVTGSTMGLSSRCGVGILVCCGATLTPRPRRVGNLFGLRRSFDMLGDRPAFASER